MGGKLLLLPNLLGDLKEHSAFLPQSIDEAVATLDGLIAESDKGGRRFLSRFECKKKTHHMPIALFNKNTPDDHLDFLLQPVVEGEVWGLVSDAGVPCVADPGSKLVWRAQEREMNVEAFVGPASMIMALMLSGLPGQQFAFNGYLPKNPAERERRIKELERRSLKEGATQIFMEAPHRNTHTLESAVKALSDETRLAVCWNLTLPDQGVVTLKAKRWRRGELPDIHKKPAVFLIGG